MFALLDSKNCCRKLGAFVPVVLKKSETKKGIVSANLVLRKAQGIAFLPAVLLKRGTKQTNVSAEKAFRERDETAFQTARAQKS